MVARQGDEVSNDDKDGTDEEGDGRLDVKSASIGPQREPDGIPQMGGVVGLEGVPRGAQDGEAHEEGQKSGAAAGGVEETEVAAFSLEVGVVVVELAVLTPVMGVDLKFGGGVGLFFGHFRWWVVV